MKYLSILKFQFIVVLFVIFFSTTFFAQTKKGFIYVDNVNEIYELGCGQVEFNYLLGKGTNIAISEIENIHKNGIKVNIVVTSKNNTFGERPSSNPSPYNNPHFYMIDLTNEGTKNEFDSLIHELGESVDNWIIGNEISDQSWNYYKPCAVDEYVKKYCESFKIAYDTIKASNPSANVYIPFDQSWDMPSLTQASLLKGEVLPLYKYNTKEMLPLINSYLGKNCEWGVAAHPYPDPVSNAIFWDDEYAGKVDSPNAKKGDKAYVVTMNNIEVMCNYLSSNEMKDAKGNNRKILISEIGFSSNSHGTYNGETMQAASLAYAFDKIKNNNQIVGFIVNAQKDTDQYCFGLRNRPAQKVFKLMDTDNNSITQELIASIVDGSVMTRTMDSYPSYSANYSSTKNGPALGNQVVDTNGYAYVGENSKFIKSKKRREAEAEESRAAQAAKELEDED